MQYLILFCIFCLLGFVLFLLSNTCTVFFSFHNRFFLNCANKVPFYLELVNREHDTHWDIVLQLCPY